MPLIEVTMVQGRTVQQKHALISKLTEAAFEATGTPRDRIRVVIREVGPDDWGVGGQPYSLVRGTDPNATNGPSSPAEGT